jgi:ABC-type amino acid transport substrate-binding protein
LRTLLILALAAALVGCSRQPPPQPVASCTGPNGFACLERTGPPVRLTSFRTDSATTDAKSATRRTSETSSSAHMRHSVHLARKGAKSTNIAAKATAPTARVPLPTDAPKTRLPSPASVAAAASNPAPANTAEKQPEAGRVELSTRMVEAQIAAARAASPPTHDTDRLVAVLMVLPDITSVSDLAGKTIAIDDRYSASNASVRTAIVAAGAPEVQLSEGQATAINRLTNGEVPAAVLALVTADAAETFPAIAGFRIFHIPLSPRALKPKS